MKVRVKEWTTKEVEHLEKLYKNTSVIKISEILGRTENSVYPVIKKLRLKEGKKGRKKNVPKEKEPTALDLKRDIKEERLYRKMVNKKVVAGIFKENVKVRIGQSYEVEVSRDKRRLNYEKHFIGEVVHQNKHHFTLKNKIRCESFLKADILIGEYKIKEVI